MTAVTVDYADEDAGIRVNLTVSRVDYGRSLLRTVLMEAAPVPEDKGAAAYSAGLMGARVLYPCMVASVERSECTGLFEHWPPTLEEFLSMPEDLGIRWERATFETNPHWVARPPADETKKASGSSER